MLQKFVIQVETTEEGQSPEEAESDLKTFTDALEDGSLIECVSNNTPDGKGYPELKHLKVEVIHALEQRESPRPLPPEARKEEVPEVQDATGAADGDGQS